MSDLQSKVRKTCSIDGCRTACAGAIGAEDKYCTAHRVRIRKNLPLWPIRHQRPASTPPEINYDEQPCSVQGLGPCHIFRGLKDKDGYGTTNLNRKPIRVHRYVWERDVGLIPSGMVIDHICRVKGCCNVTHLRVVTVAVNSTENVVGCAWQLAMQKTHCKHGHEFTPENTRWYRGKHRLCRACGREAKRAQSLLLGKKQRARRVIDVPAR